MTKTLAELGQPGVGVGAGPQDGEAAQIPYLPGGEPTGGCGGQEPLQDGPFQAKLRVLGNGGSCWGRCITSK